MSVEEIQIRLLSEYNRIRKKMQVLTTADREYHYYDGILDGIDYALELIPPYLRVEQDGGLVDEE